MPDNTYQSTYEATYHMYFRLIYMEKLMSKLWNILKRKAVYSKRGKSDRVGDRK